MAMRYRNSWLVVALLTGVSVAIPLVSSWAQATTAGRSASQATCESFASVTIPANVMQLPTNGAKVTSASTNGASGAPPRTVGSFCRVMVEIATVDPAAPPIKMEINFPDTWNGKALMYGGGGYNGVILSTGGTIRLQPNELPIPLGLKPPQQQIPMASPAGRLTA